MKNITWKHLVLGAITLVVAIIVVTFLHEVGHGLGAKIDGNHVSTGFNRVGMPGKMPDDPDFRTGMLYGVWSGLLGPITTRTLAIVFTVVLYRLTKPTWTAFGVGAVAVTNGLLRAIPMTMFLLPALGGQLHVEDEVHWGIWVVTHVLCRELVGVPLSEIPASRLLSYPAVWIPPLFSLAISLVCLVLAYRRIFQLGGARLSRWAARGLSLALPVAAWVATRPVLNALDRLIRLNW